MGPRSVFRSTLYRACVYTLSTQGCVYTHSRCVVTLSRALFVTVSHGCCYHDAVVKSIGDIVRAEQVRMLACLVSILSKAWDSALACRIPRTVALA